jgi:hypothetical protein
MDLREGTIIMRDGRVMTVQNGQMKLIEEHIAMDDGTLVRMDGTLVMRDGSTRRLKEGETLYPGSKPHESTTFPHRGEDEAPGNTRIDGS